MEEISDVAMNLLAIPCCIVIWRGLLYQKGGKFLMSRPLLWNHFITCEYCDSFACSTATIYFDTPNTLCVIL